MKKVVAHFIRKNTQLRSSFIQNQILHHIDYKPVIIYRYFSKKNDGGFAEFPRTNISILDLSKNKKLDINFRYLKKLGSKDVSRVLDFLNEHNVSVLHFHYGSDAYIYTDVMKLSKRPSVISFYGYDASSFKSFLLGQGKKMLRQVFYYATCILAMSPDMKNDLLEAGCPVEKIMVHYYGSDIQRFYMTRNYGDKDIIKFVIISGIEPQKGHIFLLKAFREAHERKKNIRLEIYGDGSIKNKVIEFVQKNQMSDFVDFKGKVVYASQEHLTILKNSDVFIHPSVVAVNGDKEGIPGAIVEAMAAGLPIISTFHAGIPYIIENYKTGILVDEWDIKSLADAIIKLAENSELRKKLGVEAQNYAFKNLDLLKKEKDLENIYNNLVKDCYDQ